MNHSVHIETVDLLRTLCRLSKLANFLEMAVVDLSFKTAFAFSKYNGDPDPVTFMCKVSHRMTRINPHSVTKKAASAAS